MRRRHGRGSDRTAAPPAKMMSRSVATQHRHARGSDRAAALPATMMSRSAASCRRHASGPTALPRCMPTCSDVAATRRRHTGVPDRPAAPPLSQCRLPGPSSSSGRSVGPAGADGRTEGRTKGGRTGGQRSGGGEEGEEPTHTTRKHPATQNTHKSICTWILLCVQENYTTMILASRLIL